MQDKRAQTRLERQLDKVILSMERMHFEEYLRYVDDRRRQFTVNFMAGVARGLGAAVGFSILGAMVIVMLQRMAINNTGSIGSFLEEVLSALQHR